MFHIISFVSSLTDRFFWILLGLLFNVVTSVINPFLNESYEVPEPFLILNVTLFSSIVAFHVILWSLAELVGAEC